MITISAPPIFSYNECLWFLDRGFDDCMHQINKKKVIKAFSHEGNLILIEIYAHSKGLGYTLLHGSQNENTINVCNRYITNWFDLERPLQSFYDMGKDDILLKNIIQQFYGLRLIGIDSLFEALCWAIIGQQVNLQFAYKIKRKLVEAVGQNIGHKGQNYYIFPTPAEVIHCNESFLKSIQLSGKKIKYLQIVAQSFLDGELDEDTMKTMEAKKVYEKLINIKGIGHWTANYAMMKCLRIPTALPIGDAGLQNAIKNLAGLSKKPDTQQILKFAKNWTGWEAYATLYLWRSLSDPGPAK